MARITQRVIRLRKEVAEFSGAFGEKKGEEDAAKPVFLSIKPTSRAQSVWLEREAQMALLRVEKTQLQDEIASLREELRISNEESAALKQEADEEVQLCKKAFARIKEDFEQKREQHDKLKIATEKATKMISNLRAETESLTQSLFKNESHLIEAQQKNTQMLEQMKDFRDKVKENQKEMRDMKQLHVKHQQDLLVAMKDRQSHVLNSKSRMLAEAQREVKELCHQVKKLQRESCRNCVTGSGIMYSNMIQDKSQAALGQERVTTASHPKPDISLVDILDELSEEDREKNSVSSRGSICGPSLTIPPKLSGFHTELGSEVQFGMAYTSDQDIDTAESTVSSFTTQVSHLQVCDNFRDEACGDYYASIEDHASLYSDSYEYPESMVKNDFTDFTEELEAFTEVVNNVRIKDRKTVGVVADLISYSWSNPDDKPFIAYFAEENNEHIAASSQKMCTLWKSLKSRLSNFIEQLAKIGIPYAESSESCWEDGESDQGCSDDNIMDDNLPCTNIPTFTYNRPLFVPVLDLSHVLPPSMGNHVCHKDVVLPIPPLSFDSPSEDESRKSTSGDRESGAREEQSTIHELNTLEIERLSEENYPSKSTMFQLIRNTKSLRSDLHTALQKLNQLQMESHQHEEEKKVACNQLKLVRVENLRLQSIVEEFEEANTTGAENPGEGKTTQQIGGNGCLEVSRPRPETKIAHSKLVSPQNEMTLSQDHQKEDACLCHQSEKSIVAQAIQNKQLACTLNKMGANSMGKKEIGVMDDRGTKTDGTSATSPFILIPHIPSEDKSSLPLETENEADQTLDFSVGSGYFFTPFQSENGEYGDLQFNHLEGDEFAHADFDHHSGYEEEDTWAQAPREN